MGIIDIVRDVVGIAKDIGNIELNQKIMDIQAEAMNMQEELYRLKEENRELKKAKDIEEQIIRHESTSRRPFITLKEDKPKIPYCAVCWGENKKLIQMHYLGKNLTCNTCHARQRVR